uniref:Maturase K n=1 Tax=Chaetosphaeridium globosum TaxID=96477 RepID=MATK_CHAGL|nr:maturase [Chaetosphaeridium globosum]Q8MA04.1 RecName: Full=Maturase K; AltName: Full=Intron maturase [Chaetosphaeridium globosum]AAM96588.1 putative intron-encoded maturase [Chaetosphaeridium globosum]
MERNKNYYINVFHKQAENDLNFNKFYFYFFQETFYCLAYKQVSYKFLQNNVFIKKKKKFSFFNLKRTIRSMRNQNYKESFFFIEQKKLSKKLLFSKLFYELLQEILKCILEISFKIKKNPKISSYSTMSSIHGPFISFEENLIYFPVAIQSYLPNRVHPELIVRILRSYNLDVNLFHFLRNIVHNGLYILSPPFLLNFGFRSLSTIFFNIYAYEIDLGFLSFLKLQKDLPQKYQTELDIFSSSRKITFYFKNYSDFNNLKKIDQIERKYNNIIDYGPIYYLRYSNILLISLNLIKKNANFFQLIYIRFFHLRFHFLFAKNLVKKISFNQDQIFFLGFLVFFFYTKIQIRIKLKKCLVNFIKLEKKICINVPIKLLIIFLSKNGFCDISGNSKSKLSWSVLQDIEIIEKFRRLWLTISGYYSGSSNKYCLKIVLYILRYSCAKTLACKHKMSLKKIWKKYTLNLSVTLKFQTGKKKFLSFSHFKDFHKDEKSWQLNLKETNSIVYTFWN